MLLLMAMAAAAPIHFHVDATELVNTVYHTGCMSGRIPCSKAIYLRFWNEKYHATPEDGKHFDDFGAVFDEVEGKAPPPRPLPFLPNYVSHFPGVLARARLMAAAFGSKSPADFRKRAAALASAAQAERLADDLNYFETRLHPWWVMTGRPIVTERMKGLASEIAKLGVPGLAMEVASFLEAPRGFGDYYLHAVPSPEFDGDAASACPVMNHFAVEIMHNFQADGAGWVALHELTHALYELSPQEKREALMRQFVDSKDPSAQSFYEYLNEAMATAVQLLSVERNGKTDDDPYREPYIPRLGRATVPLVRQALAEKRTLFDGFAEAYLKAARAALGAEADGARFRFSTAAVIGDEELTGAFLERSPLKSFVTRKEDWDRFARLSGVVLLRYGEAKLEGDAGEIQALTRHRGFAFAHLVNGERWEVLLLGRDTAAVEELATKWGQTKEAARAGLIFAID